MFKNEPLLFISASLALAGVIVAAIGFGIYQNAVDASTYEPVEDILLSNPRGVEWISMQLTINDGTSKDSKFRIHVAPLRPDDVPVNRTTIDPGSRVPSTRPPKSETLGIWTSFEVELLSKGARGGKPCGGLPESRLEGKQFFIVYNLTGPCLRDVEYAVKDRLTSLSDGKRSLLLRLSNQSGSGPGPDVGLSVILPIESAVLPGLMPVPSAMASLERGIPSACAGCPGSSPGTFIHYSLPFDDQTFFLPYQIAGEIRGYQNSTFLSGLLIGVGLPMTFTFAYESVRIWQDRRKG